MKQIDRKENSMDIVQSLINVKDRIDTPAKWCKRYMAMNSQQEPVDCRSDDACSWCLDGSIVAEMGYDRNDNGAKYYAIYDYVTRAISKVCVYTNMIAFFNDSSRTTHDDVMLALDTAIELAKKGDTECL